MRCNFDKQMWEIMSRSLDFLNSFNNFGCNLFLVQKITPQGVFWLKFNL